MNIFFTTDLTMPPERALELYAARFKIEACFDEVKTVDGFADCRQRSFPALKRHATLCLVATACCGCCRSRSPGRSDYRGRALVVFRWPAQRDPSASGHVQSLANFASFAYRTRSERKLVLQRGRLKLLRRLI